jgi:hypothetical protein
MCELRARHGRGTAWERHGHGMLCVNRPYGSCRPPDRQPTTTTGHHTTCCNLQSYAPDDGQIFVRNMLSWS